MRKILAIVLPLILAAIVFVVFEYVANKNAGKGALQVTSSPSGTVILDGKTIGKTPLCLCEINQMIPVGMHTLIIVPRDSQFSQYQEQIQITKSVLTVVDRTFGKGAFSEGSVIGLTPLDDSNATELYVDSVPNNVSVLLDGNAINSTPVMVKSVTESDHELQFKKDGFRQKILRIHTVKGYELSTKVYLSVNPNAPATSSITPTPVASPSATPAPQVTILQTPTGFLRVHSNADLNSAQIAEVLPGETYPIVSETEGWFEIKLKDGTEGWISSVYAQKQ